jgi:hypothetical protein
MLVFSGQLADWGGCSPSPFYSFNPLHAGYPGYLSQTKLARDSYLYSPILPLSPSLCSCAQSFPSVSFSPLAGGVSDPDSLIPNPAFQAEPIRIWSLDEQKFQKITAENNIIFFL